jgi:hypothetical protein
MRFKIIVESDAQLDIEQACEFYKKLPYSRIEKIFLEDIKNTYKALKINPFYQIRTKKYRAIPLKNFPFLLFFEVDESVMTVKIIALFNTHQDPENYPQ